MPTNPPSLLAMAGLATPMAIRVAATLGLVDHAGGTGATTERLASATGTSAPALGRLLDHLVTVGVFEVDAGRYRPTSMGDQMSRFRLLLDMNCAGGRAELAFVELLRTITTGEPAYPVRYGREFWADIDAQPALRSSFEAQMNWRFEAQAAQIAVRFDWSRFPTVVDLGGGDGTLLAEVLKAHPGVRGQVLDLAVAGAAARFAADGLADRADTVVGSFFDPLPTGFDAYLLSDILHDWDDEHVRAILTRCAEVIPPTGTVVVLEPVLGRGAGTGIDLFMLMCFNGRERTVAQLAELAADCGLELRGTAQVAHDRTALEFSPAAR